MKKISIKQAIIDAIEMTEPEMGRHMNFLIKKAKYIEKAIGSVTGHPVTSKCIIADGCEMVIPDDCFQIICLLPGNYEDVCNAMYKTIDAVLIQYDETRGEEDIMMWIPANTTYINNLLWREYGDVIHLINEYDNAELTLVYQKIETDINGMWIVNESHIDAVTKFLIHSYAEKYKFKKMMGEKMVRAGYLELLREYKNDYNIAVRNARALDASDSPFEAEQR